ncbi:MAG TPA: hypothetical protein PKX80_06365 [Flexilinea sp.]|jgi:hypothetical protein|nr:hypothetical protein [Flexilinea sp.]HNY93785.1 hypothetical protein [Flexilinea sp.]HOG22576.1 hypothetical protein [Flexilinea sp.]HOG60913.1 hypothetical protein [Flexilinea sp.]HOP02409.1 hypothetical protein [Flexilinea sp.]
MDYSMISKLEKAKRYAKERDRFKIHSLEATVEGSNGPHVVKYKDGKWECDCSFFQGRGRCSHTMSLEIILEGMVDIAYEDPQ